MNRQEAAQHALKLGFRWIAMNEDRRWVMCDHVGSKDNESFTEREEGGGFWWSYGKLIALPEWIFIDYDGDWRKSYTEAQYMEFSEHAKPIVVGNFFQEFMEGGMGMLSTSWLLKNSDDTVLINKAYNLLWEFKDRLIEEGLIFEGERTTLRRAVLDLLNKVNRDHKDKKPYEWECPLMQKLWDLTQEYEEGTKRYYSEEDMKKAFKQGRSDELSFEDWVDKEYGDEEKSAGT